MKQRELLAALLKEYYKQGKLIASLLKEYYLHLQIESNRSVITAIETDAKRAELRNLISDITGEDSQNIQEDIEQVARIVNSKAIRL